jgi:hypothetical protein
MPFRFNPISGKLEAVNVLGKFEDLFLGNWDIGTAYTRGSSVSHLNAVWVCVANNTGNEPPNLTYWSEYQHERDSQENIELVAGENITQYQVVATNATAKAIVANSGTVGHSHLVFGVALATKTTGQNVEIRTRGRVTNGGWSWDTTKNIFVGSSGALTQTKPVTGFSLVVATALTPTEIFIEKRTSVILT